jgi:hypothetical protein
MNFVMVVVLLLILRRPFDFRALIGTTTGLAKEIQSR